MNNIFSNRNRKFLYGIALAGIMLLLCFGMSGAPDTRAHEAGTETLTSTETVASIEMPASIL